VTKFACQLLDEKHDRAGFSCGTLSLDDFLKTKARKENRTYGAVIVLSPIHESSRIAGYYTLSSHSLDLSDLPEALRKKIPKYPDVPVTLLGRLAVASNFQGQRLGERLLMDALKRAHDATTDVGSYAVVVDPLHVAARAFYEKYGFEELPGTDRLFMIMDMIAKLRL